MRHAVKRVLAGLLLGMVLLSGCGGDDGPLVWRNITVSMPDGWSVFERTQTTLSIANVPLGPTDDGEERPAPDGDVVAMFFSYEPNTLPRDWLELLEANGAEIEAEQQRVLAGDVPATVLVYRLTDEFTDLREMVVLIPARGVVILAQPVPLAGDPSGPDVFLAYVDTFFSIIDGLTFGAPVND
jgi:hypothetical protein